MENERPSVFVIDNYDSFTFNLVHYLRAIGAVPCVKRNDALSEDEVSRFSHILVSPGPGLPSEAGRMMEMLRRFSTEKKILGVCLGMQAMVEMEGGKLENLPKVSHGEQSMVRTMAVEGSLFEGLPEKITVGRYHSWGFRAENIPSCFEITAMAEDGFVMGVKHKWLGMEGVQFHPESIMTEHGLEMLRNWTCNVSERGNRQLFQMHG